MRAILWLVPVVTTWVLGSQGPGQEITLNTLRNGGAEATSSPRGQHRGAACHDLDDWQLEDRTGFVAQASGWGGMQAPRGKAFVRAAKTTPGRLWQDVALAPEARARGFLLSAFVHTGRDRDRIEVALTLLDHNGEPIAARTTGAIGSPTWARVWVALEIDAGVAARARTARVTLTATHHDGQYMDAFADEVALWMVGPGLPQSLHGKSETDLAALAATSGEPRLAGLAGLLSGSGRARGERMLQEALVAEKDRDARHELLALAAIGGHRDAPKLLRAALERGDDAERTLALELLPSASGADWRRIAAELARGSVPGARSAAVRALVRDGSRESQRALAILHAEGDAAAQLEIVRALAARAGGLDDSYAALLHPHLTARSDPEARHAALAALAQWRDARLLAHVAELVPHEEQRGRRAAWLAWCARFDSLAAADVLTGLAVRNEARADAALLELLPAMQAPAILAWARKQGLRHAHPVVRLASVRTLLARGVAADAPALVALLRDPDPDVAGTAGAAAARVAAGGHLEALLRALPSVPAPTAARTLRALWQNGSPAASVVDATRGCSTAESATLRAVAITCLGAQHLPAEALARAAADAEWSVRAAAYRALIDVRTRSAVDVIMARLPHETGASLRAATEALAMLTGVHKGASADDWLAWWKVAESTFAIPARAAESRPAPAATAETTVAVRYHGVPVDGARLAFVLDLSGSMRDRHRESNVTKLRRAQDELQATLRRLTPPQAFAIIVFGDDATSFADRLTPATADNVNTACQWIERLQAKGWTNLWSGLAAALDLSDVDTVFLLSDGAPSVGRFVEASLVLQEARARDAAGVVRIHTIALGGDRHDRAFLHGLAKQTGGISAEAR